MTSATWAIKKCNRSDSHQAFSSLLGCEGN